MATNNNLDTQTPVNSTEPQGQGAQQQTPPAQQQQQQQQTPPAQTDPVNDPTQQTIAEMMKELAEIRVDNKKLKKANDNLASENASLKKQVNAKLTEEELRAQQSSEENEAIKQELTDLRKEVALSKATKRYMSMNMPESLAEKIAQAELEGDMETVTTSINTFMESQKKEVEEKVKADLYAQMPNPASGNGDGQIDYEKQYNEKLAAGDNVGAIMAQLAGAQQAAQ